MASKTIFRALGIEFKFGGIEFTREPAGGAQQDEPVGDGENPPLTGTDLITTSDPSEGSKGIPRWLRPLGPCPYMKLYCIVMTVALISAFVASVLLKK